VDVLREAGRTGHQRPQGAEEGIRTPAIRNAVTAEGEEAAGRRQLLFAWMC